MTSRSTPRSTYLLLCVLFGCAGHANSRHTARSLPGALSQHIRETVPPLASFAITDRGWQRHLSASQAPDTGQPGPWQPGRWPVAARIFAFADSQLHYQLGKRTFAQSPFAERMSFEVAVRPAALDNGSDLLLALFLDAYRARYGNHALVFLGDAADLSCTHELDAFLAVVQSAGVRSLLSVTSNHDGFYAGNFTSRRDLDGKMRLTDMPRDWTRACARPGSLADERLTKGRAVARLHRLLPDISGASPGNSPGPTDAAWTADGPTDYRSAYLYYVRRLGGGQADAPPVFGVFLDTVDYRGFDFEGSRGAGSSGAVAREQLHFLDRAMLHAASAARSAGQPATFVVFGHHPFRALEPASRRRVREFFRQHRDIVAYVSAHTHESMETRIVLSRRARRQAALAELPELPELIVGSTTDPPQSARTIEIRVDPASGYRSIETRRLQLDSRAMCAGITPMAADTTGYTGYRILRDGTPTLDISWLEKLLFAIRLDDLAHKRALQAIGALLMENELVRAWARLYRDAPIPLTDAQRVALDRVLSRRYAAGQSVADLRPYLRGQVRGDASTRQRQREYDPVIAPLLAVAERGVHRFATHEQLVRELRALRTHSPAAWRYFACHALLAARAESKPAQTRGDVLYIR